MRTEKFYPTSEMSPYGWMLLLPSLYRFALCSVRCGKTHNLDGEESGEVVLQVVKTGVKEISWVLGASLLAITKPHEPVDIKARQLRDRLYNGTNGSLRITGLTKKDQELYVANVRFNQEEQDCNEYYNLTVYSKLSADDIKIHHNITRRGTCNVTLTCAVDKTDVSVYWNDSLSGTVKETPTVQVTEPYTNSSWTCTASHRLAAISRTVIPLEFCQNGYKWEIRSVALGVGLLLLTVVIICCLWGKRKNICRRMKWKKTGRRSPDDPQQLDKIYWEIDQPEEVCSKSVTATRTGNPNIDPVYMTVGHAPLKPAHKRGNLLQDGDMYSD